MVLPRRYRVFVSHASIDGWVAGQIVARIQSCGATTFLDTENIESGDEFEGKIVAAAEDCDELVVLLTPTALERPYVWIEIGMFMRVKKRIVTIVYGITPEALARDTRWPLVIKKSRRVDINDIEVYFRELSGRIRASESVNG
jgi:hypothetical protein